MGRSATAQKIYKNYLYCNEQNKIRRNKLHVKHIQQFNRKIRKSVVPPSPFASYAPPKIWGPLRSYRLIAPEAGPEPRRICRYGGRSAGWIPEEQWFDSVPGAGNYAPQRVQTGSGNNPAFYRIGNWYFFRLQQSDHSVKLTIYLHYCRY